jgi:hypothetical protein
MSGPLRVMVRLGRFAPPVLRGIFRLNLRAMRDGFMACFQESCRQGARGPGVGRRAH